MDVDEDVYVVLDNTCEPNENLVACYRMKSSAENHVFRLAIEKWGCTSMDFARRCLERDGYLSRSSMHGMEAGSGLMCVEIRRIILL